VTLPPSFIQSDLPPTQPASKRSGLNRRGCSAILPEQYFEAWKASCNELQASAELAQQPAKASKFKLI
jgi:hypothetical protein